tara:strand:- start:19694 stop:21178 length:1485 start_codon:yes stop_codon:yes gene_type:complete
MMTGCVNKLPCLSGREAELAELMNNDKSVFLDQTNLDLNAFDSCFSCALHMHQPTIPAGESGELISHLQYMFEHQGEGDNHNAEPFAQCYRRLADLLPQLIDEGCSPRIMLDYSGNLLWGFEQMERTDITDALHYLTCDTKMQKHVEWLGTFWSHAVAPSTPVPDLFLQINAWQHHFAAMFGDEALTRVRGFSLPEMHLPNHPDTLYEFIKALKQCGYRWLMVQEHSVETLTGEALTQEQKYAPNQLRAINSNGESISITTLIKTQGSDTKLVGQMQPYYEALGKQHSHLATNKVPAIVVQIADGENGGVMMNEFPSAFCQANQRLKNDNAKKTVAINGSEYLELLQANGIKEEDFPQIQAINQNQLWQSLGSTINPVTVESTIKRLKNQDQSFAMSGASWTNNISWVDGYENVLEPMNQLSARFHQEFDQKSFEDPEIRSSSFYQEALLHLLLLETSCFRYWGQGSWTSYAQEIYNRGEAVMNSFKSKKDMGD